MFQSSSPSRKRRPIGYVSVDSGQVFPVFSKPQMGVGAERLRPYQSGRNCALSLMLIFQASHGHSNSYHRTDPFLADENLVHLPDHLPSCVDFVGVVVRWIFRISTHRRPRGVARLLVLFLLNHLRRPSSASFRGMFGKSMQLRPIHSNSPSNHRPPHISGGSVTASGSRDMVRSRTVVPASESAP